MARELEEQKSREERLSNNYDRVLELLRQEKEDDEHKIPRPAPSRSRSPMSSFEELPRGGNQGSNRQIGFLQRSAIQNLTTSSFREHEKRFLKDSQLLLDKHSKSFCFDSRHPEATPAFVDHQDDLESPIGHQHLLSQLGSDPNKSQLSEGDQVSRVVPNGLHQLPFYDDESLREGPPKQFESEPVDGAIETLRSEYQKRKMLNSSKTFGENFEGLKSKIDSQILMSLQKSLEPGQLRARLSNQQIPADLGRRPGPSALDPLPPHKESKILDARTGNYELDIFKDSFKKKLALESEKSFYVLERPKADPKPKDWGKQVGVPEMKESRMTPITSALVGQSEAPTCECSCQRSQIRININGKPVTVPDPVPVATRPQPKKRPLDLSFRKTKGAGGLDLKGSKAPLSQKNS